MGRFLLRGSRVVVHSVVGGALLGAGLVMLVTPGPGLVIIVLGLAVLAREFHWADRLRGRVLGQVRDVSTSARAHLAARWGTNERHEGTVTDLRRDVDGDEGLADGPAGEARPAS